MKEQDAPERIWLRKVAQVWIQPVDPNDDDVLYTRASSPTVEQALESALQRTLTMLKSSLAGRAIACADEGIMEAERALDAAATLTEGEK